MLLLLAALTGSASTILLIAARRSRPSRSEWAVHLMAVPAIGLILYRAAGSVVLMLSDVWTFIRLMPAVALFKGYRLYYPDGQGPLLGWSYGPTMPCAQFLIGALPDPVSAVIVGGIVNELVLLLPILLLLWRALPASPTRPAVAILILSLLQALFLRTAPGAYWLRSIQVDTFSMGLLLLGVWILLAADPGAPLSRRRLILSAAVLVAAVFSKQTEVCALPVAIALVWARDGRRAGLELTLALAIGFAAGFLLLLATVGWEAMYLNLWLVPARHPQWEPGPKFVALMAADDLEMASGFLVAFVVLAWIWHRMIARASGGREWILNRPWIIPAAMGVLLFPISVLGRAKAGGADNTYHSLYFLVVTIGMMAAGLWSTELRIPRVVTTALVLVVALSANGLQRPDFRSFEECRRQSVLQREYDFARRHPGQVWFSANPLATLYSDGKLYHQGYGVYDRTLPNLPPTPRHLHEHLPADLRWVSWPGRPFWMPDGVVRIPTPEGQEPNWFEVRPAGRP